MEEEISTKGRRRKLKRIVQKKPKVNLNSSGSVAYYKKVKAALNASLNSSRVRQSLQANNKALAQSLQHVKQELRNALNENARLTAENQDLHIRIVRFENHARTSIEYSSCEQRLQSLKTLLHEMSRHLLEVGTCLHDGIDLCVLTPRTSQSLSSASRPSSFSEQSASAASSATRPSSFSEQSANAAMQMNDVGFDFNQDTSIFNTNIECTHSEDKDGVPTKKSVSNPDMSVIMEQSFIDLEDGEETTPFLLETLIEESILSKGDTQISSNTKKVPFTSKLPQRLLNNKSRSEDEGPFCGAEKAKVTYSVLKDQSTDENKSRNNRIKAGSRRETFTVLSAPEARRETFVVSKLKTASNDCDISKTEMPDLMSSSPLSKISVRDCSPGVKNVLEENVKYVSDEISEGIIDKNRLTKVKKPIDDVDQFVDDVTKNFNDKLANESSLQNCNDKLSGGAKLESDKIDGEATTKQIKEKLGETSNPINEKEKFGKVAKEFNGSDKFKRNTNASKVVSVCNNQKLQRKEQESFIVKGKKATASGFRKMLTDLPPTSNAKKDIDFFISNPCLLNLVHQRVTGTKDGCIDTGMVVHHQVTGTREECKESSAEGHQLVTGTRDECKECFAEGHQLVTGTRNECKESSAEGHQHVTGTRNECKESSAEDHQYVTGTRNECKESLAEDHQHFTGTWKECRNSGSLDYQQVTGIGDACVDLWSVPTSSTVATTVSSFIEEIKASNRNSRHKTLFSSPEKVEGKESGIASDISHSVVGQHKRVLGSKVSTSLNNEAAERMIDHTVYFDSDMEFTEIIPQTLILEPMVEEPLLNNMEGNLQKSIAAQGIEIMSTVGVATKIHSKHSTNSAVLDKIDHVERNGVHDQDSGHSLLGEEKRSAVALRVNKPGQIVFAASRKEGDGTRKAIPPKLTAKRSKSKKQIEELKKNFTDKEPQSIFDFHDKTPQISEEKALKMASSVFDLSLNETVPPVNTSLASFRERFHLLSKELNLADVSISPVTTSKERNCINMGPVKVAESTTVSLLGDVPEYRLPLKDDSFDEPQSRSHSQSVSRAKRGSRGSSRSKSRSLKFDQQDSERDNSASPVKQEGISHLGRRVRSQSKSRTRSRSAHRSSHEEQEVVETQKLEESECIRNTRSKGRVRKTYHEADGSQSFEESYQDIVNTDTTNSSNVRSRSRKRKSSDEEYEPPQGKHQPRGRSRNRRRKSNDEDYELPPQGKQQHRERSKSRCKVDCTERNQDIGSDKENKQSEEEIHITSKSTKLTIQPRSKSKCRKSKPAVDISPSSVKSAGSEVLGNQLASTGQSKEGCVKSGALEKKEAGEVDSTGRPKEGCVKSGALEKKEAGDVDSQSRHRNTFDKDVAFEVSDWDPGTDQFSKITDRRDRSRSNHRKMFTEVAFNSPSLPLVKSVKGGLGKGQTDKASSDEANEGESKKQIKTANQQYDEVTNYHLSSPLQPRSDLILVSSKNLTMQKHSSFIAASPKRSVEKFVTENKQEKHANHFTVCNPVPSQIDMIDDDCLSEKISEVPDKKTPDHKLLVVDKRLLKKDFAKNNSSLSPVPVKKEGHHEDTAASKVQKIRNKKPFKNAELQSVHRTFVKNESHLPLEKQNLEIDEINMPKTQTEVDILSQVKKPSRPLILPADVNAPTPDKSDSFNSTSTVNSKENSVVFSKKAHKTQLILPQSRKQLSCTHSLEESCKKNSTQNLLYPSQHSEDGSQTDRRARRAINAVSYKEPTLNTKLRREDVLSASLHKSEQLSVCRSPRSGHKRSKTELLHRGVLDDLTNFSKQEAKEEVH